MYRKHENFVLYLISRVEKKIRNNRCIEIYKNNIGEKRLRDRKE